MYCVSCSSPLNDHEMQQLNVRRGVPKYYCTPCSSEYRKWSNIRRRYKITKEEYEQIVENQKNKCVLCEEDMADKKAVVDHCHTSGEVRGILCNNCNALIGFSKEEVTILRNAISYLKKWKVKAE